MKIFTKPAIAIAALVITTVAMGSATYAAIGGWPTISALFGGQQPVDGGRIVQVNTEHCVVPGAFTITTKEQPDTYYYKVHEDSKMTNEQVVQLVRGYCIAHQQAQFDQDVLQTRLNSNLLNKDRVVGHYLDSVVTAVDSTSISLDFVMPIGNELKEVSQTFKNIDPQVLVYDSPRILSMADIKVGDHVSIKYRASGKALTHSETTSLDNINPDEQVVVAIIKITADMSAAIDFQKYHGKEFEQVVPCGKGYCTVAEYMSRQR